jgi:hypothetical protein
MTTTTLPALLAPARRLLLQRRIRIIVAITITYNVIEAIVAITAGTVASSTALIGFGLDSIVEVLSAAIAWQFAAPTPRSGNGWHCESSPSRSSDWPPMCPSTRCSP